jgi:hypothetical protein
MEFRLALQGSLRDLMARQQKVAELGVTRGVHRATEELKQDLRDQVVGAGMGQRLAKTWQDKKYPFGRKTSLNAAGWIWSNAPQIIRAHSQGVTIRAANGTYLAVPTDNAPERGPSGKAISPSNFPTSKFGELRFVPRSNGPPLLVIESRFTKSGRVGKAPKNPRKKSGDFRKRVATIPMFTLLPQVRLKKRLDPQRAANRANARIPSKVSAEIRRADREVPEQQGGRRRARQRA